MLSHGNAAALFTAEKDSDMKGNCFEFVTSTRRAIWGMAAILCITLGMITSAAAAPVVYTGITIADGQLGNWSFHNARITLRFSGDTNNVQVVQFTDPTNGSMAQVAIISQGRSSITVSTLRRTVHATFAPNQIFVSLDQGDPTSPPLVGGRGVGFGMFSATAPGGVEPAYPFGIEDGTVDFGDAANPSFFIPTDLTESVGFSGRAFVCLGFPNRSCPAPTSAQALHTDKGDLLLFQPYEDTYDGDTIQAGFFLADVNPAEEEDEGSFLSPPFSGFGSKPISYNGFLVADVSLGGQFYGGAEVYFSFVSDASRVVPFSDSTGTGFINPVGLAQVKIRTGGRTVSASLAPNQLYVYFDTTHWSVGFGSYAGGRGYPLSLTQNQDQGVGLVENSALWALSDLAANGDTSHYTAAVPGLATDLTNETVLSAAASSCASSFDPVTSICGNTGVVIPLHTSRGDLLVYEDYTDTESAAGPYSVTWGMFWSVLGFNRE